MNIVTASLVVAIISIVLLIRRQRMRQKEEHDRIIRRIKSYTITSQSAH